MVGRDTRRRHCAAVKPMGSIAPKSGGRAKIMTALVALIAATVAAVAADYPSRPITLIVPYPAGGGNDVLARLVAAKMSASLGEPIVIENRGGAGSTIGTRDAARSSPDGYTLLIATSSLAINPSLYPDAAYDSKKDFTPIGLIGSSPNLVLVNPSVPARSIAELIALAKNQPGKIDFASTGIGTSTHLSAVLFAQMAHVMLNAVPYKGVAPALAQALHARVAIMGNGPRKGGAPETWATLRNAPGMEDIWQVHYSMLGTAATNPPADFIANPEAACQGKWIKLSARPDGAFTVTNSRNGFTKTYGARN